METSQEPPPPYEVCSDQGQNSQAGYPPPMYYPPDASYTGYYPPPQLGYQQSSMQTNNNIVVTDQPTVSTQQVVFEPYKDHMNAAIWVTLCCFWPTGILAIIRACDARSARNRGDNAAAALLARSAKGMIYVSIAAGILTLIASTTLIGVIINVSIN